MKAMVRGGREHHCEEARRQDRRASSQPSFAWRIRPVWGLLCLLAVSMVAAPEAPAAELRGKVELFEQGNKRVGSAEVTNAVVFFQPETPVPLKPPSQPLDMITEDKQFEPRVLPVIQGSTVQFPNRDPILHNVFSVSPGNAFDLGFYQQGEGKAWRFEKTGLVRVYCNVHYDMVAYVLVLDTPHFVSPEADGSFRLTGLPEGPGRLTVWQERARPWSRQISVPNASELQIALPLIRPRVPKHTNKLGKPYPGGGRGRRY